MLSNQILHKTVQDVKRITGLECAVWDMKGICLVMTNEKMISLDADVSEFCKSAQENEKKVSEDVGMFLAYEDEDPCYVFVLKGDSPQLEMAGRMGVSQLENLLFAYKERMDKNRFIQNLILDNLLLVDVYNQAKKMKIPVELRRTVFLIEAKNEGENLILETLKGLYATGTKDFVTAVDEKHVILVRALEKTDDYQKLAQIARELVDTLNMEAMVSVRVSYGTIIEELKDVSKSYKEADMALEVGRVFYSDKNILAYNELGIGRLIHQLPSSLCEMFLEEVFQGNVADQFEEEELTTVYTFFDNNLNISETARQLYVHRNTLVYRLEKIQKKTGLDVRVFDDALTFKIAMMVADHMKYINN
ncbi:MULTISPECIES: PucR family transcriptional regulator [Lachnospiraceae]|uniref:PucR family transcriptional regulator n=1 Tax=Lachnospiraceae TaxID=186803 RepID=UPI001F22837F|nr:helix-turn-helix domain-containing protein [Faecalicatena contorta]MCI6122136.1 helix-turn-helix domain-containing protein [Lachnospiraceae bacterium]MCI6533689.1 helix-turn-helix domain-containing protein [Lachnospiraceae bacterium]MDY2613268.1 helix-turn-helix domain-containing protein [Lachnospiraceae bacterium]MDY4208256.1 helix-turn-helix domain-containing protein [Lachnospiraceae bacterium]